MPRFFTDCLECGRAFQAQRKTAKFCSARCRQRHNRRHANTNIGVEASTIRNALARIRSLDDEDILRRDGWMLEAAVEEMRMFVYTWDTLSDSI